MLVPVAQHQTRFNVPGLSVDSRGVAVGRLALVLLPSLDRVVAALATLTAEVTRDELYRDMSILRIRSSLGAVEFAVRIGGIDGSLLDRVDAVAALGGGELLTGGDGQFVRYRDRKSPLGYDVDRLATGDSDLLLYGRVAEGAYDVEESIELRSLILRLAPRPARGSDDLSNILVLARRGLRAHVERVLWRRELSTEVSRLETASGEQWLYRVKAPPRPLVGLMGRTPGLTVYLPVGEHLAVERGFEHPFALHACQAALGEQGFHFFDGHCPGAQVVADRPAWLPLRHGVRAVASAVEHPVRPAAPGVPTQVELRLVPDGLTGRREAVFVPERWSGVLRRVLYAVPPGTLAGWRAAAVQGGVLLVSDGERDGLPLGVPLRRVTERVYVPVGRGFQPRVGPELIAEAAGDTPGRLTFFVDERPPFSVAESLFEPADRVFLARLEPAPAVQVELPAAPGRVRIDYADGAPFPLWGRLYGTGGESGT